MRAALENYQYSSEEKVLMVRGQRTTKEYGSGFSQKEGISLEDKSEQDAGEGL